MQSNGSTCYRLKFEKRKRQQVGTATKRAKMETSTPNHHRQLESGTPESSPIRSYSQTDVQSLGNSGSSYDSIGGNEKTGLSWEKADIVLDEEKSPEPLLQQVAREVVTVESFAEAEVGFLTRSNINGELDSQYIQQLDWSEDVKFKANDGDTKSFELAELLQEGSDFDLEWLFVSSAI